MVVEALRGDVVLFSIVSGDAICHYQRLVSLAELLLSNKGVKLLLIKALRGSKYKAYSMNNPIQSPVKIVDPLV